MKLTDKDGNVFSSGKVTVTKQNGKVKTVSSGGGSPTGAAGGDLTGTYPNPGVNWSNGLVTYNSNYYPLASNPSGYLTAITSLDITTALGYTPYNSSNPSGYITSSALSPYLTLASAASTYVPLIRSITINGNTQNLSTDISFTVSASNPEGYTVIEKSANQDVTNSGVVDDTDLNFTVVAGGHYMINCDLVFSANNTTGDGTFRYAVNSGTMKGLGTAQGPNASGAIANVLVVTTSATTNAIPLGSTLSDIDMLIFYRASFSFQASANGLFSLQFGNNTPGAGRTTRMWKGSLLRYKRID